MRWVLLLVMGALFWHGVSSCGPTGVDGEVDGEGSKPDLAFLFPPDEPNRTEPIPQDWLPEKIVTTKFVLSSSAFKDGKKIPTKYGCETDGNFLKSSIPLSWKGAPEGTKSFVIIMDDLAPIAEEWVHWVVYDIPASANSFVEGASPEKLPKGAKELKNTWQVKGFGGPCPPQDTHTYRIRIFALDKESIELIPYDKSSLIVEQLKENLGVAELRGTYPE